MGYASTEQTVEIIEAVGEAIHTAQPETVTQVQADPNYWWLLTIAIVPVLLGIWLKRRGK